MRMAYNRTSIDEWKRYLAEAHDRMEESILKNEQTLSEYFVSYVEQREQGRQNLRSIDYISQPSYSIVHTKIREEETINLTLPSNNAQKTLDAKGLESLLEEIKRTRNEAYGEVWKCHWWESKRKKAAQALIDGCSKDETKITEAQEELEKNTRRDIAEAKQRAYAARRSAGMRRRDQNTTG